MFSTCLPKVSQQTPVLFFQPLSFRNHQPQTYSKLLDMSWWTLFLNSGSLDMHNIVSGFNHFSGTTQTGGTICFLAWLDVSVPIGTETFPFENIWFGTQQMHYRALFSTLFQILININIGTGLRFMYGFKLWETPIQNIELPVHEHKIRSCHNKFRRSYFYAIPDHNINTLWLQYRTVDSQQSTALNWHQRQLLNPNQSILLRIH